MSSSRPPAGDAGASAAGHLPERSSLEQLRKQAKDLLREVRAGDPAAVTRLAASRHSTLGSRPTLADVQLAIAREYGFASWPRLVHHVKSITGDGFAPRPLIRPVELASGKQWALPDGRRVPADDVFSMFVAARDGDMATVKRLVENDPALATVEYNYTPPIHFAVRECHLEIAAFLLNRGADPAYRSYPFQESLLTFAEDRSCHGVAALLRAQLSRRFPLSSGMEAILTAATKGDVAAVKAQLARKPALARASNDTGDTALHRAARSGHVDAVRVLLDAGADVDAVRGDGYRPVHCALMPNWFARVDLVGPREEIVNLFFSRGARYTVFIAALRGDREFVRDAMRRDPSLANFEDTCHHRVLSAAVRRGDAGMTRLLLEHGANPNLSEEGAPRGASLLIAVSDRQREIVHLLLAHGADPNAEVDSSGTPMSRAEGDAELLELLRKHGGHRPEPSEHDRVARLVAAGKLDEAEQLLRANLHWIRDNEANWGDGILAGPARDGRNDVIAMLLRLGARVPLVSKWAPYYYFKHEATAAFLLEHGMDANHMNWHRFTLLHHMAAEGEVTKAKLLLSHGAEVDAIDDEYRSTPLGVAARRGQSAMVELLLESGADPMVSGALWALPLAWAERKGHARIAARLREAGAVPSAGE